MGEFGAGKSTLVAALAARGYQVISDDVCFLQLGSIGYVQSWPGLTRIRLWEGAMEALGCRQPGVERELRGYNKFLIPTQSPPHPETPRRLQRIYQLCAAPKGDPASVNCLQGAGAVEVLIQNVYRLGLAERMGQKPAAFLVCATTARNVRVFRFSRAMGFDILPQGVKLLEDHMRDLC